MHSSILWCDVTLSNIANVIEEHFRQLFPSQTNIFLQKSSQRVSSSQSSVTKILDRSVVWLVWSKINKTEKWNFEQRVSNHYWKQFLERSRIFFDASWATLKFETSTVVENLTTDPEIDGSIPAAAHPRWKIFNERHIVAKLCQKIERITICLLNIQQNRSISL